MQKSSQLWDRAQKHMPLGVADSYRYWGREQSVFVKELKSYGFTDVDDKEFIDFRLGYGPIILGYRDPRVDSAVIETIQTVGTMSGFSVELDSEVCERIKSLCPQMEKMRFANSGTEAVMGAVRVARGVTGRQKIVVIEGGFHGLYDEMMWKSDVDNWDPEKDLKPEIIPFGKGLAQNSRKLVHLVPLNNLKELEDLFATEGQEIAAVVIEPIMGNCGSISATPEYLKGLKALCKKNQSLLIMDEVKTGFRVAKGGVQELYGVQADLTTYAKAMGNGYPVAVFGGKAEFMDHIAFGPDGVTHGGTYTANLVGLAAAKATLDILSQTDALKTVEAKGKEIIGVLSEVFQKYSLPHCFAGHPSMFGVHLSETEPLNYRDWKFTDGELYRKFALNLIEEGIMLEPDSREPWFICEAHKNIDLDLLKEKALNSLEKALRS